MAQKHNFDIETILAEVESSELNEAFHLLASGENYRVGVTASFKDGQPLFSIELYLCVLQINSMVEPELIENSIGLVSQLKKFGYSAFHQDNGWIVIDKITDPAGITSEIENLLKIVADNKNLF